MRLHGNQHLIRSGQGVNGQHTQGGAAVQQDHIVLVPDAVQIVPQLLITTAAKELTSAKATLAVLRSEMTQLAQQLPEYESLFKIF